MVASVPEKVEPPVELPLLEPLLAAREPKMPPSTAPAMIKMARIAAGIPYLIHLDFPFLLGAYEYFEALFLAARGDDGRR